MCVFITGGSFLSISGHPSCSLRGSWGVCVVSSQAVTVKINPALYDDDKYMNADSVCLMIRQFRDPMKSIHR
jgi:hypothetical protein